MIDGIPNRPLYFSQKDIIEVTTMFFYRTYFHKPMDLRMPLFFRQTHMAVAGCGAKCTPGNQFSEHMQSHWHVLVLLCYSHWTYVFSMIWPKGLKIASLHRCSLCQYLINPNNVINPHILVQAIIPIGDPWHLCPNLSSSPARCRWPKKNMQTTAANFRQPTHRLIGWSDDMQLSAVWCFLMFFSQGNIHQWGNLYTGWAPPR